VDTRKELDSPAVALMLVLCLVWGLQQSVLKLAAGDIAPVMQLALRSGIAALCVVLFMLWRRESIRFDEGTRGPGLLVGCLFALEFLLVGQGIRYTSASHAVVFLYTAPVFAALGLHLRLPAERLGPVQWLGIAVAFAGVATAFFGHGLPEAMATEGRMWLGDLAALAAGMAWHGAQPPWWCDVPACPGRRPRRRFCTNCWRRLSCCYCRRPCRVKPPCALRR